MINLSSWNHICNNVEVIKHFGHYIRQFAIKDDFMFIQQLNFIHKNAFLLNARRNNATYYLQIDFIFLGLDTMNRKKLTSLQTEWPTTHAATDYIGMMYWYIGILQNFISTKHKLCIFWWCYYSMLISHACRKRNNRPTVFELVFSFFFFINLLSDKIF